MPKTTKRVRREVRPSAFSLWKRADIEVIARELRKIEDAEGDILPARLVELASAPAHPLHRFLFSDSKEDAAAKWRLELARRMIRAVQLVYVDDDDEVVASAPAMVSVVPSVKRGETVVRQRRYISVERAFADPTIRAAMLRDALAAAEAWEQRYKHLSELGPVFDALRAAKKRAK